MVNARTLQEFENTQAERKMQQEEAISGLKQEWGEEFDRNIKAARVAVNEFGGDDLKTYLQESGLSNDPQLVKAFSKIGQDFLKEDSFTGDSTPQYGLTADEAQAKINDIMGDMNGPYYNSAHPDHKRIVNEVNKLFQTI
jgi:hypothetical protein